MVWLSSKESLLSSSTTETERESKTPNMVAVVSQEDMVALVSRTGRHLQRYSKGRRQVVGFVFSLPS